MFVSFKLFACTLGGIKYSYNPKRVIACKQMFITVEVFDYATKDRVYNCQQFRV